ncbi:MAG TPA: RNA polymerase subunit sigma-70 [Candidatus Limnocylindrales bacterium]|nr:RNA polymerase subunit sigma-70 [Candidatus Limnocylindrales bacterium]
MNVIDAAQPRPVRDRRSEDASAARDEAPLLAAARAGDESAFAELTERYRRQLHVHAYRMLGSVDDADDIVQETYLRAWTSISSFEGRSLFRTWIYRIATNLCLNVLARRPRRVMPPDVGPPTTDLHPELAPSVELPWLQPYPDRLLEPAAPVEERPDVLAVSRETIELAYLAAIQHLPPRQRAVLILRDALAWSAKETAQLLETSVAAVNSALQRARATMRDRLPQHAASGAGRPGPSDEEQAVLRRYIEASERADAQAFVALLRDDVRQTMPPLPVWWDGKEAVAALNVRFFEDESIGPIRALAVAANRQPAAAFYLREPGDTAFRLIAIDVLRVEDGGIAEIDTFDAARCPGFDLPATLPGGA